MRCDLRKFKKKLSCEAISANPQSLYSESVTRARRYDLARRAMRPPSVALGLGNQRKRTAADVASAVGWDSLSQSKFRLCEPRKLRRIEGRRNQRTARIKARTGDACGPCDHMRSVEVTLVTLPTAEPSAGLLPSGLSARCFP